MNLNEIKTQVASIANLKATNTEHLLDMYLLIGMAYQELWLARPWVFAQRLSYMNVYPDITFDDFAVNCNLSDFTRRITFSGPIYPLTGNLYEGQYIELQGRDYKILKVVNNDEIQLEEPFRGTPAADYEEWKLKIRTYTMPEDSVQVLSVAQKDHPSTGTTRRYIQGISSHIEEAALFSNDRASAYADFYIPVPFDPVPSGEKLNSFEPAELTPCTLTAGNTYEFAWAFKRGSLVGPLSDAFEITVGTDEGTAGGTAIGLRPYTHNDTLVEAPTFSATTDKYKNPFEGLKKVLYVNVNYNHTTGERLGVPKWVEVTQYGSSPTQYDHLHYTLDDESTDWIIRYTQQINPGNKQYIEVDGHYNCIRFYPRINAYDAHYNYLSSGGVIYPEEYFKQIEIRYIYKPKALCLLTDTPEMPYELHNLIVYKTLDNYYTKMGNAQLAQLYRTRYENDLLRAEKRYVERSNLLHQRLPQYGFDNRIGSYGQKKITLRG